MRGVRRDEGQANISGAAFGEGRGKEGWLKVNVPVKGGKACHCRCSKADGMEGIANCISKMKFLSGGGMKKGGHHKGRGGTTLPRGKRGGRSVENR